MSIWTIFANVATGTQEPASNLDTNLATAAGYGVQPCTAAGTNAITLAPVSGGPAITSYNNLQLFGFVAVATSTSNVTVQVNALGFLPLYQLGTTGSQVGANGLTLGAYYQIAYNAALNGGGGGFVLVSTAASTSALSVVRSYIAGLTLSNDSGTPNSVLDVAAGTCADSTDAVMINLGAFTKSTGGSWVAGSGGNGMGNGLTIADNTWYHVFAIINATSPDVYFDTSVTAANAPTGTTAFRRIGSFLTNASADILGFKQIGRQFLWGTWIKDISAQTPGSGSRTLYTLSVPPGVFVRPLITVAGPQTTSLDEMIITSPNEPDTAPASGGPFDTFTNTGVNPGITTQNLYTNTSSQLGFRQTGSTTMSAWTRGWLDDLGAFN